MATEPELPRPIRRRSPLLVRLFTRHYARRYLAKHFHGVRLSRSGPVPSPVEGPLIVLLNHPSWWDPLLALVLSERFTGRTHFAPIDARMLQRYRFFERLGFFGIEPGSVQGGREFLRQATAILAHPGTTLWITGQGQFCDPRRRPPGLQAGLSHLIRRLDGAMVLPLALEYPFWNERTPEALARFGTPLRVESGKSRSADEWLSLLESSLAQTQDVLAEEAMRRDAALFEDVIVGSVGVGGIYDLWRRFRSWLRGEVFRPEHMRPEDIEGKKS